jgi:D-2-hydroxyacid dehydrogenase (NADP+)
MILTLIPLKKEQLDSIEEKTGERPVLCDTNPGSEPLLEQAEIMIGWSRLEPELLQKCPRLKWLCVFSAGVEALPFETLRQMGITVTNLRGAHGPQMAEQAFGMMILFSRRLKDFIKAKEKRQWRNDLEVSQLSGKTLCVIGAGSIGTEFARKAKAFDMDVIGIKRSPGASEYFDRIETPDQLIECLSVSDYNALLTPLTDETRHMIGKKEFAAMKKSSIFINMSRGGTVDETAMIEALRNGEIAGACLDVFSTEPLRADSPLWDMDQVVMTPHVAGAVPDYMQRGSDLFAENLICYRRGDKLLNQIRLDLRY